MAQAGALEILDTLGNRRSYEEWFDLVDDLLTERFGGDLEEIAALPRWTNWKCGYTPQAAAALWAWDHHRSIPSCANCGHFLGFCACPESQ